MMTVNTNTHTGPSFSLKNRLARVIWGIVYIIFFRFSPRPLHRWRSFILRLFGAKIGKGVHVYPAVRIWAPWNLEIDDFSGVANNVILYSQGKISLGKYVVVSQGAHLCTGTHNYQVKGFPLISKPIFIGDYVWIAAEAFIHPGITIEEGVVVGARSVVTNHLPAWKVCAGNPCLVFKERVIR
jgi:putative colanic acid biosynthesis acetyltransferase WcaF